jgi:hypothetical protein
MARKRTGTEEVAVVAYDAGYRQCAEDTIKRLEPIRYTRIRIGMFKEFADWIWGVAWGQIGPAAAIPQVVSPEPAENAQVEGSDAREPE